MTRPALTVTLHSSTQKGHVTSAYILLAITRHMATVNVKGEGRHTCHMSGVRRTEKAVNSLLTATLSHCHPKSYQRVAFLFSDHPSFTG